MSQFLPESMQTDGQIRTPTKGPEAFLSRDEETFLTRMLSFPESLPPKFKSWLTEYLAVNMQPIPSSQIVGGAAAISPQLSSIATTQQTASATYTDLATVGPTVTGLSDGQYLLIYGASGRVIAAPGIAMMSVKVNSTAATDADLAQAAQLSFVSIARATVKTLANNNNNTVTVQYKSGLGATTEYEHRWLVVLKTGN